MPTQFRRYSGEICRFDAVHRPQFEALELLPGLLPLAALELFRLEQRAAVIWALFPDADTHTTEADAISAIIALLDALILVGDGVEITGQLTAIAVEIAVLFGIGAAIVVALVPLIIIIETAAVMTAPIRDALEMIRGILSDRMTELGQEVSSLAALVAAFTNPLDLPLWDPHPLPTQTESMQSLAIDLFVTPPGEPLQTYQNRISAIVEGRNGPHRQALVWCSARVYTYWILECYRNLNLVFNRP